MKKVLVGAAVVAAGMLGTAPAPASACDPGMPTCYGPERWLDERLWALEHYVIEPTIERAEDVVGPLE